MNRFLRILAITALVAAVWFTQATSQRRLAMIPLLLVAFDELPEVTRESEGTDVRWYDDYYTVTRIDEATYAIGEPLNPQQNYNYLILGQRQALLFDSGTGVHDIRPVVDSLTTLPVLAVPSHLHYDHIGIHWAYEDLGLIDLPYLRRRAPRDTLEPGMSEHLGFFEGIRAPTLHVRRWLAPGSQIDLGSRTLEVLHTPGHTPDSMALYDADRDQLFIGDFITEGPAFLFLPHSSLGDQLRTARTLLERITRNTAVHTAHRFDPPGLPTLGRSDVEDLHDALVAMRDGRLPLREDSPWWPRSYPVNDKVWIFADFAWAHSWD